MLRACRPAGVSNYRIEERHRIGLLDFTLIDADAQTELDRVLTKHAH
jgi:hypothetical protein